jgi:hypothetical protein
MYTLKTFSSIKRTLILFTLLSIVGCQDDYLDEEPLSSLSADNTLVSPEGFEKYLNGLYWAARAEYSQSDNLFFITNFPGTNVGEDAGAEYFTYRNWVSYLTPINSEVNTNWDWAYSKMLPQANTFIVYANKPENKDIWRNESERNAVIAQARFFRGYAYNSWWHSSNRKSCTISKTKVLSSPLWCHCARSALIHRICTDRPHLPGSQ